MENIRINKQELLTIVKENRKKHKLEYSEAIKAYRVKAGDLLEQEVQKIINGEKFELRFNLQQPRSYIKEYDLAIQMLEMSIEDSVEISDYEFRQLVNDEWDWKESFRSSYLSNSSYVGVSVISGSTGSSGCSGTEGTNGTSGTGYSYDVKFSDDEYFNEE